jgi:hypothetical protein
MCQCQRSARAWCAPGAESSVPMPGRTGGERQFERARLPQKPATAIIVAVAKIFDFSKTLIKLPELLEAIHRHPYL